MKFLHLIIFFCCIIITNDSKAQADQNGIPKNHIAPAPLFRDPITDGAADPVLIWNREEKNGGCSTRNAVQM